MSTTVVVVIYFKVFFFTEYIQNFLLSRQALYIGVGARTRLFVQGLTKSLGMSPETWLLNFFALVIIFLSNCGIRAHPATYFGISDDISVH